MKRILVLLLCFYMTLVLFASCGSVSPTPSLVSPSSDEVKIPGMSEPFSIQGGTLVITEVTIQPWSDTKSVVQVTTLMDNALADSIGSSDNVTVKTADGTVHRWSSNHQNSKGDKTQIIFVYAVPKETKQSDLTFWINDEWRKLTE